MFTRKNWLLLALASVVGLPLTVSLAQDDEGAMQLPPGWTMEDMQACMIAGQPGAEQEKLAAFAGTWSGETEMWMAPEMESMKTPMTWTSTPIFGGRYLETKVKSEMPGMGTFEGLGFYGYDNVGGEYVATWLDNHSTKIMHGTGTMSPDGKTLTWRYEYTCPVRKEETHMREVQTLTADGKMTFDMFMVDPVSGKEFKAMASTLTKK